MSSLRRRSPRFVAAASACVACCTQHAHAEAVPQHALWCEQAEEEEEEEEEAAAPKKKKGGGSKGWGSVYLNPPLNDFMGVESCPRSDVVKEIWRHVKEHNLQLPTDKRFIICDVDGPEGAARLQPLFPNRKKIHMFKMNAILNNYFGDRVTAASEAAAAGKDSDEGGSDASGDEDGGSGKRKAPAAKANPAKKAAKKSSGGGGGGFAAPVKLSSELQDLLGSGETLPRTEVVKQLWAYIKGNELQNPANRSQIIPDDKMKKVRARVHAIAHMHAYSLGGSCLCEHTHTDRHTHTHTHTHTNQVFGKDPFTGFSMMKLMAPHVTKL